MALDIYAVIQKKNGVHLYFLDQNRLRMCLFQYYRILILFRSPAPDVTNLFPHKLAYPVFFKMADEGRKFYDIFKQLNVMGK